MTTRFAFAAFTLALACTLALAQDAASAPPAAQPLGASDAAQPSTQPQATVPDLPGDDCDLAAAVALADSIIVAKAADIDSAKQTIESREGTFGLAHLSVSRWLKGQANDKPVAYLPVVTADDADPPRVAVNATVVMFLARDGESPILFKALAADDRTIASIADLIKTPPPAQPAGTLGCDILISDPPAIMAGTLLAALALTNNGDQPIRICVAGSPVNGVITDANNKITGSDVRFEADKFNAAPPPDYEMARQIVTIPAKRTFRLAVGYAVPETGPLTLTGHFSVSQSLADKLNLWQGSIDAKPHAIVIPAPQPPQPPQP